MEIHYVRKAKLATKREKDFPSLYDNSSIMYQVIDGLFHIIRSNTIAVFNEGNVEFSSYLPVTEFDVRHVICSRTCRGTIEARPELFSWSGYFPRLKQRK